MKLFQTCGCSRPKFKVSEKVVDKKTGNHGTIQSCQLPPPCSAVCVNMPCDACNGTGHLAESKGKPCQVCGGTGVAVARNNGVR